MTNFIFPSDPLSGRGFDPEYAQEFSVLQNNGQELGYLNHDQLTHYSEVSLMIPKFADDTSIYRGWMLNVADYTAFYAATVARNATLLTHPTQYVTAHQIDGWLPEFSEVSFPTVLVSADATEEEILSAVTVLDGDKFFIKDYVKSRKDEPELSVVTGRENLYSTIQRFIEAQGEYLAGDIVIRQFVPLAEDRVEIRAWWRDGEWRAFTAHPDYDGQEISDIPQDLLDVVSAKIQNLGLFFVSVDFTVTASGDWVVIEIGDGQVSGFPATIDPETIISILN
jgi:hypothetical protein